MSKSRRKLLTQVVQWTALVLALLDAVLYLALVRPARHLVAAEAQERDQAKARVLDEIAQVDRLKKFQEALPAADDEFKAFVRDHVPSRRHGFSRAARIVRRLSEQSGLQLGPVSYRLSSATEDPLERLGIEVTVEGPYQSLLKFAHALETGSDFILVHDFTFEPGEGGGLALRLGADLYLVP